MGSFLYVYFNRAAIISRVSSSLNDKMNGELLTGKVSIDFFHYFPSTSIHFSEVSVRDSMFGFHKMDFLRANHVFVKINFKDLFSSGLDVENITFQNGSLFVFKDGSGYSNKYLLEPGPSVNTSGFITFLHEVILKDFRIIYRDQSKNRIFNVFFYNLRCAIHEHEGSTALAVKSDGKIKLLAFNINKGTYAKDATFSNDFIAYYQKRDSLLEIPEHTFYLNDQLVEAKAVFRFSDPGYFSADLISPRIFFDKALKLTNARTSGMLSQCHFSSPLRMQLHLGGSLESGSVPMVTVRLITAGNAISYKDYHISKGSLQAFYTNRANPDSTCSVSNTRVIISGFSGEWQGIPVSADTIKIYNFPFPTISTVLHGIFPLQVLNNFPDGGLYTFTHGTCSYGIEFNAINDSSVWHNDVNARITIQKGKLVYEPRGMPFHDINAIILVKNNDVVFEKVECMSGTSLLLLNGIAPGIFDQRNADYSNTQLNWFIKSDALNLEDFTPFLGARKLKFKATKRIAGEQSSFGRHLDRYLNTCNLNMKLDIAKIRFDKFTASNLDGVVQLVNNTWLLEEISFNHADGKVQLEGKLSPVSDQLHSVTIQSKLEDVNISKVFTAFDNFSQQTLTASQIEGVLDASVKLKFNMNPKAVISQSSIDGVVDLSVREGELKGFQPMGKLSKFLFRNRDFSTIRFSELTNNFIARGQEIYFDRMKINSSLLELYIEGSYFLNGKTDLQIQIPVSNLKKRDWEELSDNITDKGQKGMNVFIHTTTDDNGELRFRYDPLKKLKEKRVHVE